MSFSRPSGTVIPDEFFDYWLTRLSTSELRVLCYLMRRTFGFKRYSDLISLQQFMHGIKTHDGRQLDSGCGVTNKTTITKALRGLQDKDLVTIVKRLTVLGDSDVTLYALKVAGDTTDYATEALTGTHGGGGDKTGPPSTVGTKLDHGGAKISPRVGTKLDPQIDRSTNNSEQQTGDLPLPPTAVGNGGEGDALPQFTLREDSPHNGRCGPSTDVDAVLEACASLLDLPYDRSFRLAWSSMIGDALREGEPGDDITGCLRWMLLDPEQYWQKHPQFMGPGAVLRKLSTWRGAGRPTTRARSQPPARPSQGAKGGIPRTSTATDAALRAAHERLVICDTCHKELGWGTCAACQTRAAQGGLE